MRPLFLAAFLAALALPARADVNDDSLYLLSMQLRDQHDRTIGLDTWRGHPVIVSMFYGSCPMACPMLVSRIREIEAALDPETRDAVRILLVTFDPERDTPAVLAAIVQARGLDDAHWTLATAPEENVRVLAAVLGVKYRRLPEGGFNHTSVITLLDREGRIDQRYEGLSAAVPSEVAARLAALAR